MRLFLWVVGVGIMAGGIAQHPHWSLIALGAVVALSAALSPFEPRG